MSFPSHIASTALAIFLLKALYEIDFVEEEKKDWRGGGLIIYLEIFIHSTQTI